MIKLADATLPDGAVLTQDKLTDMKNMLHSDQKEFIMATDALREKRTNGSWHAKRVIRTIA